jgi:putative ABC transport system permease protein
MDRGQAKINPYFNWVGPGYFKTLRIPLLAGRGFDAHDTRTSPKVAIVTEAFAQRRGLPAIRSRSGFAGRPHPQKERVFEIVGLVKNAKYRDLSEELTPTVFLPMAQQASPEPGQQLLIPSSAPLGSLVPAVKGTLNEVNPALAFFFSVFQTQIRDGSCGNS